MSCDTFQAELPDLLYGELAPERRATAESHARACPACAGLLDQLRGVRGALPPLHPPAHLAVHLKLAARDALLHDLQGGAPGRSVLGATAALLLAACVAATAFALGVAYERGQPARLEPVEGDVVTIPSPPGAAPNPAPGHPRGGQDPATGAAWQRVLLEAGRDRLEAGQAAQARTFFLRSAAMAPATALATAARIGAAEALARQGQRPAARAELEALRTEVRGGVQPGDAAHLQRIAELLQD